MYNLETTIAIIVLLVLYPIIFITRPKLLAAKETEDEYEKRSKANNIAVTIFSLLVILGVVYNATFY